MRKILFLFLLLGTALTSVRGEERLQVETVEAPQGGETEMVVNFLLDEHHNYVSYQFKVELPAGITLKTNEYGKASICLGDGQPAALFTIDLNATSQIVTCYSNPSTPIGGSEGVLVRIPVIASEGLAIGEQLSGKLSGVVFSTLEAAAVNMADVSFNINIVEKITLLNENDTELPTAANGVKVKVVRTISANSWSTICLPFAMTEEQVAIAFGTDVELADFTSWSSEEDDDGNIVAISVGFTDVTEIEANHPYIIKVKNAITEFTADGVDIEAEEEPSVMVGKKKAERGYMIGNYVAGTTIPENDLFLNGSKFWYSKGRSTMKAFRAYFEFADVLTNVEEAGARIVLSFPDEPTGIDAVSKHIVCDGQTYNLLGGKVSDTLRKGIYIRDGKKMVVK